MASTNTGTGPEEGCATIVCSLSSLEVLIPEDIRQHIALQYAANHDIVNEILQAMKTPPAETICRVNLIRGTRDCIQTQLEAELERRNLNDLFLVRPHVDFQDVLTIHWRGTATPCWNWSKPPPSPDQECLFSNWPARADLGWPMTHRAVIVDRLCGEAVLRGSHIFVRGILCADRGIQPHDTVAVYADVRPTAPNSLKIKRGCFLEDYHHRLCVYLGLGRARLKRSDFFRLQHGTAIEMLLTPQGRVGPMLPPISGILPSLLLFQNLPSIVVAHALAPQPGDVILDMCAAPGGKTSHLASLVQNEATIVACDQSRKKMLAARAIFQEMGATCITPLALDTTNCVQRDALPFQTVQQVLEASSYADDGLRVVAGFFPESFDRILLDPPCSALGLRPKLQVVHTTLQQLQQVCIYQRKFVREAEALLKPGGTMTYSTCTFMGDENERMVRFMLDQFPNLELLPILPGAEPSIGGPGLPGLGLDEFERSQVKRFDPLPDTSDTIGFFVAKFRKRFPA